MISRQTLEHGAVKEKNFIKINVTETLRITFVYFYIVSHLINRMNDIFYILPVYFYVEYKSSGDKTKNSE